MNQFKDTDLREALRRKYSDTPQLPADFMASMKQRMEADVHEDQKPAPMIRRWRWMAAAACLLLIIGIGITLWQKEEQTVQSQVAQKIEQPQTEQPKAVEPETVEPEAVQEPQLDQAQKAEPTSVRTQQMVAQPKPKTELAKAETATEPAEEVITDTPPAPETDMAETLTERDIPITRPENYKYTPEELALLKKQASEAYLKWVELELEISRYTLEQTAQK